MAQTLYAGVPDMTIARESLDRLSDDDVTKALTRASAEADSYLGRVFDLPLTLWGEDLRGHVGSMATYYAMTRQGFNPDSDDGKALADEYDRAISWLKDVAKGQAIPTGVKDASSGGVNDTPGPAGGDGPFVVSGRSSDEARRSFWQRDGDTELGRTATLGPPKNRGF